jgi:hypothetical protein
MKIKWDFVTNSSSTCYILKSEVSGYIPQIESLNVLKDYHKETQQYIAKSYAYIRKVVGEEFEDDYSGIQAYTFYCTLKNTMKYSTIDIERDEAVTIFNFDLINENPYDYDQLGLTKEILEDVLLKQLKIKDTFQLMYHANVHETSGDGWDGGDPSGPSIDYTYTPDLHMGETKTGILTVMNNTIIDEVRGIGELMSFNQMVLDNINDQGLRIEGTK